MVDQKLSFDTPPMHRKAPLDLLSSHQLRAGTQAFEIPVTPLRKMPRTTLSLRSGLLRQRARRPVEDNHAQGGRAALQKSSGQDEEWLGADEGAVDAAAGGGWASLILSYSISLAASSNSRVYVFRCRSTDLRKRLPG